MARVASFQTLFSSSSRRRLEFLWSPDLRAAHIRQAAPERAFGVIVGGLPGDGKRARFRDRAGAHTRALRGGPTALHQ